MSDRTEFEMTEEQLAELLDAGKPVICMKIGNYWPRTPQQNANSAWRALGKELGFKWDTVSPVSGKGRKFFTAEVEASYET